MLKNKQDMLEVERKIGETSAKNKQDIFDLEQKESDLKVLTKKRLLDLDREDFEMRRQAAKPSPPGDFEIPHPSPPDRGGVEMRRAPKPPLPDGPGLDREESLASSPQSPRSDLDSEDVEKPEMPAPQPFQPDLPEAQAVRIITVRDVMIEYDILVNVPQKDRTSLMAKAEKLCAVAYREAGRIFLPKIKEGLLNVRAYKEDDMHMLLDVISDVVTAFLESSRVGPLTMAMMSAIIPNHIKKTKIAKILRLAENMACTAVKTKYEPEQRGYLLAKVGKLQTFDEEDRDILIRCISEAELMV